MKGFDIFVINCSDWYFVKIPQTRTSIFCLVSGQRACVLCLVFREIAEQLKCKSEKNRETERGPRLLTRIPKFQKANWHSPFEINIYVGIVASEEEVVKKYSKLFKRF